MACSFLNVVVGIPLTEPQELIALNNEDWKNNEKNLTYFTKERFLPKIMKEIGLVSATSEVRRNKPELMITLDKPDCFWLKWGKKKIWFVVGAVDLNDI